MVKAADTPPQQLPARSSDYAITIKDCNSITEAQITLRRESLNIKYGPNGIGKSTIARALVLNARGGYALQDLLPFKYRHGGSGKTPTVVGADEIKNVLVFDEHYVSQFVFQPDEVVKNSFEIFIKTPEYQAGIEELEAIFEDLKKVFLENEALDDVIASFTELRNAFTITKSGGIAKTSKGFRALGMGGKLAAIPKPLLGFEKFLHSDDPAGWLSWQSKGKSYLELSDNCPFCSIPNMDKKTAVHVSEEYESAAVKNMGALRLVIDKLADSFVPERLEQLRKITTSLEEISPEQHQFLASLRGQVETLLNKFTALKELSFVSLRDEPDVDKALGSLKIELELLDALNSEDTQHVVGGMNAELDRVALRINDIKRRVGIQKTQVAKSIERNQDEINEYLRSAGYKYAVRIESSGDSYRMVLEHQDAPGHLEAAASHLSFGERNAFALVLFMHQVRRDAPDLVVLDDPVSSFDKTKKFAILHKLFHGKQSLRGFTTLLLTHDIEPAIDIVRTATSGQFQAATPAVHFLQSREGRVEEKPIKPADIMTFSQVCDENIGSSADPVIKCIYLRRRYEVHGERGAEYHVLSSLLHVRDEPSSKGEKGGFIPLGEEEREQAIAEIQEVIPGFDYDALLAQLKDRGVLKVKFEYTNVGYEKVQIFRIASVLDPDAPGGDAAFKKFVNESYHIENEYVMQLNPREFDAVPEHVVQACADLLV
ncbi:AAA family ATPase [Pseudofrankia sp. BMG5.37]|uniref:AAA family ATPase n=1 Tax=Pseudofrankia sp. BMG5.37 TaxID=3050035 RepID=UPI00289599FE|nr:AAA family ATPase [Pseudofrankia sp. BMG5.37]MDT3446037.1 AAA family ATPase [Pseudofrankia sp. BMG5.37]